MVDLLNAQSIDLAFPEDDFYNEQPSNMPELKKKQRKKQEIPHFPNVDVPMKEEDILNYKKEKYQKQLDEKKTLNKRDTRSEQIKLKSLKSSISQDENIDEYHNDIIDKNSIVADAYVLEDKTNNYVKGYYYHKLGNCYSFCASKGNPLIIIGPKWYNFFIISILVNSIIWFYIIYYGGEFNSDFKISGVVIVEIFQWSFIYNFICNPGFPKNNEGRLKGIPKEKYKYCSDCYFYINKNKKVKHCFDCGFCVEGFHRHSMFLSKCVGRKNLCMYYVFLISLLANAVYLVLCVSIVNS